MNEYFPKVLVGLIEEYSLTRILTLTTQTDKYEEKDTIYTEKGSCFLTDLRRYVIQEPSKVVLVDVDNVKNRIELKYRTLLNVVYPYILLYDQINYFRYTYNVITNNESLNKRDTEIYLTSPDGLVRYSSAKSRIGRIHHYLKFSDDSRKTFVSDASDVREDGEKPVLGNKYLICGEKRWDYMGKSICKSMPCGFRSITFLDDNTVLGVTSRFKRRLYSYNIDTKKMTVLRNVTRNLYDVKNIMANRGEFGIVIRGNPDYPIAIILFSDGRVIEQRVDDSVVDMCVV